MTNFLGLSAMADPGFCEKVCGEGRGCHLPAPDKVHGSSEQPIRGGEGGATAPLPTLLDPPLIYI